MAQQLSIRELAAQRIKKAQSGGFEKTDYSKIKFKPETGKEYQVRILPNKYSPEYPIQELEVHNYDAFKKSPVALSSYREKDPVVKFVKDLWAEVNQAKASNAPDLAEITKENSAIAKALKPRKRFFAQVVVRGEEAKGAIIWEFGSTVAQQIDGLIATEDYEALADIQDGVDLTVTGFEATMKNGKTYTDVTITPKRKSTPLSKDSDTVEKWLEEQKDPAVVLYKTMTYDELKQMLKEYLEPGDDDEEEEAPKQTFKKVAPLAPAKAPVKQTEPEEEEEEPPFKPEPVKIKKPKKPVVEEVELDEEEDELSEQIPNVIPKASTTTTKTKTTVKEAAPKARKSFDDMFDKDDEE